MRYMNRKMGLLVLFAAITILFFISGTHYQSATLGPLDLVASSDGQLLYIAQNKAKRIDVFNVENEQIVHRIPIEAKPTGLTVDEDKEVLYVTVGQGEGKICVINLRNNKLEYSFPAGHSPMSPQTREQDNRLYICNRFANKISVIDPEKQRVIKSLAVPREPIALKITPDNKWLLVANHLPDEASTEPIVASKVSLVSLVDFKLVKNIALPNGSSGLRDIGISADGRYAFITHVLGRYTVPTTQLEQGWMNTNALSIINLKNQTWYNTILLDDVDHGAANPWGVICSDDGDKICVSHAGTHEVSIINADSLLTKLKSEEGIDSEQKLAPYNLLNYLYGLRHRIKLDGNGPRGLTNIGNRVFITEYFTDSLSELDLNNTSQRPRSIPMGKSTTQSVQEKGEMYFNDGTLCFQEWQSCTSCHPDARVDGFNWDLLNDGIGNPKNVKSLLLSHVTPPVMCTGVRPNAETAVRAGMTYIQFAVQPESNAIAIDEYLKSMQPVSSPYLKDGELSESAQRGKKLFFSQDVGCFQCHPPPLYTDQQLHDVGTVSELDSTMDKDGNRIPQLEYDTPTLIEVWRTAPYLHDGRYRTVRQVITTGNHGDLRGRTSHLTESEIEDLMAFVLSL